MFTNVVLLLCLLIRKIKRETDVSAFWPINVFFMFALWLKIFKKYVKVINV